ncbi:MAG: methylenetetrahydrofolate reductase [NAD(P)H] [Gammaproteobacteria bacterium]|nr:methylenetetrahydrofolate reductase [NAD(P)H] [Gammaproteobacteria bacterium]
MQPNKQTQKEHSFSFEFFPPKTAEGAKKLENVYGTLKHFNPDFFSVTYGASGGSRERTLKTVLELHQEELPTVPHISCMGASEKDVLSLLALYQKNNIRRLVVLRGDVPIESHGIQAFRHANELVTFIRQETRNYFEIEVAAYPEFHPEAKSPLHDLLNFKKKVDAGANRALTQYFFNVEAYFRFVESCEALGIKIPIVPGIMPITDVELLFKFSHFCGADIPTWLKKRLEEYKDKPDSLIPFGIDVVTRLCETLLKEGAPGLHFYTLNQLEPTRTIFSYISRASNLNVDYQEEARVFRLRTFE